MKKTIIITIISISSHIGLAQTNIFPADGNVGIGTLSPDNQQGWNKVLELVNI